jgi:ribose transport system substrate-binding protein
MKRFFVMWCVFFAITMPLVAQTKVADQNKQILIFAVSPFESQYFATWLDGAKAAAKILNIDLRSGTAGWDPSKQNALIQSGVAAGARGVLVSRVDLDAFVPLARQLDERGVAIITTDGPIYNGARMAHFSVDDMVLGKEMGALLLEGLEKSGKQKPWNIVAFAGLPGTYSGMTRVEGALAAMKDAISKGDVKLVSTEIANFDRQTAMEKMQGILTKNHKIDGVLAANDDMTMGAMKACESAGLVPGKDTIFVGIDVIPDAIEAITQGKAYGSVSQAPYLEGYWGITTLYAYLKYGITPDSVGMSIPPVAVTKKNVSSYESLIKYDKPASAEYFRKDAAKYKEFVSKFWH